ncbi:helix-turn-helix domain-containing protein [Sinomonas gamaensis]|uniref:helix-turn-helix domain-containing protein n=1 Tax=Sinomonas gamaensis TaxID=2565624 RepID=UPI00110842A1|nr:helix-turn-helix domain-containing protein [Sinomonas gamaensis]
MEDEDDLLTVAEVAERLRVTAKTVYSYIRAGRLPAARLGRNYRVRWADYRAFITPPPAPLPRSARSQKERIAELMRRSHL